MRCFCNVIDQPAVKNGTKIVPADNLTASDVAKANFREYEGLLVCPPHNSRVPGVSRCQCALYPLGAGIKQIPNHLQDSRLWLALKTLQVAKQQDRLKAKVLEVLENAKAVQ